MKLILPNNQSDAFLSLTKLGANPFLSDETMYICEIASGQSNLSDFYTALDPSPFRYSKR